MLLENIQEGIDKLKESLEKKEVELGSSEHQELERTLKSVREMDSALDEVKEYVKEEGF